MVNTEKFIELVRSNAILYDIFHEDFRNISKKKKVWHKIGRELNESGEQSKKRWKNLKDTYAKHIKSMQAIVVEGKSEVPLRKWIWADRMKFIRPFLSSFLKAASYSKSLYTDYDSVEKTLQNSEIKIEQDEDEHITNRSIFTDENSLGLLKNGIESVQPHCSHHECKERTKHDIPTVKVNRKRKSDSSLFVEELIKRFDNRQILEHDATDLLLLAYGKTIKSFSKRRQVITKMKIGRVIMEQELLHLDEVSNTKPLKTAANIGSSDSDA